MYKVIKRDGIQVDFEIAKISDAIKKAFEACERNYNDNIIDFLALKVTSDFEPKVQNGLIAVEDIQDSAETVLVQAGYADVAKAYILYRNERNRAREMNTRLMKVYEDLTFKSSLENDIKRENANIDGDTAMGTMLKYGSEGAKQFNMMFMMKPEHAEAHRNGDIHIHDLDFYATGTLTCCQSDPFVMFENGGFIHILL